MSESREEMLRRVCGGPIALVGVLGDRVLVMTPDPLSTLIADCRALIATMGPALDLLETARVGGAGHGTQAPRSTRALGRADAADVPSRPAPPMS